MVGLLKAGHKSGKPYTLYKEKFKEYGTKREGRAGATSFQILLADIATVGRARLNPPGMM